MKNTMITAHSGCEGTPDNSMESIRKGIELGADCIEIDVRMDRSGGLRLTHNALEDYSSALPLETALRVIAESDAAVNCDLKEEKLLYPVLEAAEAAGFQRDKLIFSGSVDVKLLEKDPSIVQRARIFLNSGQIFKYFLKNAAVPESKEEQGALFDDYKEMVAELVKQLGVECINLSYKLMSPARFTSCRDLGIGLSLWTVNEEADQERLLREDLINMTTRNVASALRIRDEEPTDDAELQENAEPMKDQKNGGISGIGKILTPHSAFHIPHYKGRHTENKVLLILVDGMRADSVAACGNPDFQKYFEEGTHSYTAQTTYPPVTLPAHMSLFHSVKTERHGVWTNTYVPQNHPITGLFETIDAAKKRSAVFYSWQQMRDCWIPRNSVSFSWMMNLHNYWKTINVDIPATKACKEHIAEYAPDFVWLYLGMVDEFGHAHGWMSPGYLEGVRTAADCVLDIVSELPPEYSVIVTADHGGHERNHGDDVPEDMTIPVSCHGPMFEKGKVLSDVSIIDIAPTITDILGIDPDPEWEGRTLIGR